MKLAAIQYDIVWADPGANFELLSGRIGDAVATGADLVLLPETFSTGFGFGTDGFPIEPEGGISAAFLSSQAQRHQVWVAGSCPEVADGGDGRPFNSFVFAAPDGSQHRYRKIHPFSYGREDEFVRPGDEVVSLTIAGARVTPFVCYDLRFATEFWDVALDTDVYVVVANWPAARREHWLTLLRARAIENLAYVVGVNRIGSANGLDYAGDTIVYSPVGATIANAGRRDGCISATIAPAEVAEIRQRYGFLDDRRFGVTRDHAF